MSQGQVKTVELLGGPLDGALWNLLAPESQAIVVSANHCGPYQPARTVRYLRHGDGKFRYDPSYGK